MNKLFTMHNGKWTVQVVRSAFPGHLTGWITKTGSTKRYVFSVLNGEVRYTKEIESPRGVPHYVDDFILNLQQIGW